MKALLKLISLETVVGFIAEALADLAYNDPVSPKAKRIRRAVQLLRDAAETFLAIVPE